MHQRLNPRESSPDLFKAMNRLRVEVEGNIDTSLFELVKLRASMLNGCGHCIDIHSADALRAGEETARLFGLSAWWECPWYSPKERAALALTDAATRFGPQGVPDEVYDAARAAFEERELVYLVAGIGMINMWNRLGVTFQLAPPSAVAPAR